MALNGHAQGRQEPLRRVKVHDDPLIGLDLLAAGRERLRVEAEVEDDLLGRRRDATEIGVRREGRRGWNRRRQPRCRSDSGRIVRGLQALQVPSSRSLISFSPYLHNGAALGDVRGQAPWGGPQDGRFLTPACPGRTPISATSVIEKGASRWSSSRLGERRFHQAIELGQGATRCGAGSGPGRSGRPAAPASGGGFRIVEIIEQPASQLVGIGHPPGGVSSAGAARRSRESWRCGDQTSRMRHTRPAPSCSALRGQPAGSLPRTPHQRGPRPPQARRLCRSG